MNKEQEIKTAIKNIAYQLEIINKAIEEEPRQARCPKCGEPVLADDDSLCGTCI